MGHHRIVRTPRLPNLTTWSIISAALLVGTLGCGRKGDPIPHTRAAPAPCSVRWASHRILEVTLPGKDARGADLVGVEKVRIFYLPLGTVMPTAQEVIARGEVVLERSRPDLPGPGSVVKLDMRQIGRPAGWIVATAVRVGNVVGAPSEPVPWLDPAI
jgi:hypothetical protein